ncbi:oocyte-secreted protein 2 [Mustela erminea]|uniref:oocyte-secreted protein 2 n=1 Tax=Mustela erminea TaxID=36723 RepID=UPI0013876520|nr:oocyte-secreted protein 2 [Mustela erminea]
MTPMCRQHARGRRISLRVTQQKTVVSEDTLLFQTEMYFNPRNLHCDPQKIPLECSASRKSVWLTPVSTENEIKLDPSPFIADFETTPEELGLLSPEGGMEHWN